MLIEDALREVVPGRYDRYENLLDAVAAGEVWMLLWHGTPGGSDVQYGNLEVDGYGYAPCVTSADALTASGWTRAHRVVPGREIAAALYRERWGLWLNPHQPGGGVGIPWADLRRIAGGLDRLPAGPLALSPVGELPADVDESVGGLTATADFYDHLVELARETPAVLSLRRAWVHPSLGESYIVIGLDMSDTSESSVESVRRMMERSVAAAPDGLAVSTVALADPYDPVAAWLSARVPAFYRAA